MRQRLRLWIIRTKKVSTWAGHRGIKGLTETTAGQFSDRTSIRTDTDPPEMKAQASHKGDVLQGKQPIMKRIFCVLSASLILSGANLAEAALLANWTFETSVPTTAGPYAAENGVNAASSFASGSHTSGSAVYSNPSGNGSVESYSANFWGVNDYWQFTTSSSGYQGVTIAWDQGGSATGPLDFVLQYSVNGGGFTQFGSPYTVLDVLTTGTGENWLTGTPRVNSHYSIDLSSETALDNATSISFRLVDNSTTAINSGTVGTTGTDRVDNFSISAVPEPVTWALIAFGTLFGAVQLGRLYRRHLAAS
jgi:hypothetical protein